MIDHSQTVEFRIPLVLAVLDTVRLEHAAQRLSGRSIEVLNADITLVVVAVDDLIPLLEHDVLIAEELDSPE